ncbi:MAG: sensor histidine kinase, partial [Oscillospiraceae bacterium]|nr:sensor histidine kinase [Oscillospiraceae bacterium]
MAIIKLQKNTRQGIRRRWMTSSLGAVFLILVFAITAFSAALGSYYYSTMSSGLQVKAESVVEFFGGYATQREYYQHVAAYVNDNPEGKDNVDMQFLGANGSIRFSTFGLAAYSSPGTPDIAGALNPEDPKTTPWIGRDPSTGERIMAVTAPMLVEGRAVSAVRYVTSLR